MTLAHYTHVLTLAGIACDGIKHGEVPVTRVHVVNYPWFTSEFSQDAQEAWVGNQRSKRTLRLEVDFPDRDERLVRWRDYAKTLRVQQGWYDALTGPNVAQKGRSWFVYRGVVPFDWIKGAYFHSCRQRLTPDDLRLAADIVGPLNPQFAPALPCRHC